MRKIVSYRYAYEVRIPDKTYRHVKIALEHAWTIINFLEDASPMPAPKERDAHLRTVVRESVKAYYELEATKLRELILPPIRIVSDPLPRPPQRWKGERF